MNDEIVIGGDMEDIPEGTYHAIVKSVTTKESDQFGAFRAWDFQLDSGSIVGGATSMSTGSKSKGGRWITAILGRKPIKGESVSVVGRPCLVQVVEKNGWPAVGEVMGAMVSQKPPDKESELSGAPAFPAAIGEMP